MNFNFALHCQNYFETKEQSLVINNRRKEQWSSTPE